MTSRKVFNIFLVLAFFAGVGLLIFGQFFSGGEIEVADQKVSGFNLASIAGLILSILPLVIVFGEKIKKLIK